MSKQSSSASADLSMSQKNQLAKKLGGNEAARRFLKDELVPPKADWIEIEVRSNGTTSKEWIARLQGKGKRVEKHAKRVLLVEGFEPTNNLVHKIAILRGDIFLAHNRNTKNIGAFARDRGWMEPNPEIGCLLRERFTSKEIVEMGLTSIITMHKPIMLGRAPHLLMCNSNVHQSLDACLGKEKHRWWPHEHGFAYLISSRPA